MLNQTVPTKTVRIKRGKPHAAQLPIIRDARRFNVLVCGRRFGKTRLGVYMLAQASTMKHPCAWFAPTYKDILEVWREVNITLKPIIVRSNIQERRIELQDGGSIEFWSLENEDAGRGRDFLVGLLLRPLRQHHRQPREHHPHLARRHEARARHCPDSVGENAPRHSGAGSAARVARED